MARAFWKGVISFGMVVFPVKMYVATEIKTPSFHLLHRKDLVRAKQVLYCEAENEYFTRKDSVRGYEYARGQYVVLTDADLDKVPVRSNHTIDILGFVKSGEIDPVFYFDTHYLEPEEVSAKPYSLLREALVKTDRLGVAKVTIQRREHLCCLRPKDMIMVLHTLHFSDEIRPESEVSAPQTELRGEELDLASSLVNAMAKTFVPDQYHDEYRQALEKVVQAKIQGQKIEAPEPTGIEIPDLMAALRASIEAAQKQPEAVPSRAM